MTGFLAQNPAPVLPARGPAPAAVLPCDGGTYARRRAAFALLDARTAAMVVASIAEGAPGDGLLPELRSEAARKARAEVRQ